MRSYISGVCLAAVATLSTPLEAGAGDWSFSTQQILADGEWNNPSSVASDECGIIHIAYMTQHDTESATKEIWYAHNAAGPESWSFVRITNNAVREEFPHLVLDDAGNVHIAFHTGTGTSNKIRYVNNVGQLIGSFNPIIDITGSGYVIVKHAVDASGTVHFVFRSQTSNSSDEVFYTSWNSSTGVGPLQNLSNSPGNEWEPTIAVGSKGSVHIAWYDGTFSGPLVYVNNTSGTFQAVNTGVTATNTLNPVVQVLPGDVVSIIYRIGDFLWAIDDGGTGTWSAPAQVYVGSYRPSFYNKFSHDTSGRRYLAFASNVGDNRGIFFIAEGERGFEMPVQIASTASGNQGASVHLNSHGQIVLTYQYGAFDAKTDTVFANLFIARSALPQPCPADIAPLAAGGDGMVNVSDLLAMIGTWGPCDPSCPAACIADLSGDAVVNVTDLLNLIGAWGACD